MKQRVAYVWVVAAVVVALSPGLCSAFTTDALEEAGLSFSGCLEVELSYLDGDEEDGADVAVSTVELGVEYSPVEWLSLGILFLYEDGSDGVEVDEAYGSIGGSAAMPVVFTVGRLYLPVGAYPTVLCTDPLTQTLGEAQEEVLQVSYDFGLGAVTAGIANGDVEEIGEDDTINLYYAAVEVSPIEALTAGVAFTSNLADSNELTELMPEEGVTDQVSGIAVYVVYESGPFYGSVEYVTALDGFEAADLDTDEDGSGDEPEALNIEVGYEVMADVQLGARYGTTNAFADFPEDQYGVVVNYTVFEGAVISLEYLHNEFAGGAEEDSITGRLAIEF